MTTIRTFIVEDNLTIRETLVGTLREVARVDPVGQAETEAEGSHWLSRMGPGHRRPVSQGGHRSARARSLSPP